MEQIAVFVNDLTAARHVLQPMREGAGPTHWVLVACPPTRHIGRWVSHAARQQWRERWAAELLGPLQADLLQALPGGRVETLVARRPLAALSAQLLARMPNLRLLDARRPRAGRVDEPISAAHPASGASPWAAPVAATAGLTLMLSLADWRVAGAPLARGAVLTWLRNEQARRSLQGRHPARAVLMLAALATDTWWPWALTAAAVFAIGWLVGSRRRRLPGAAHQRPLSVAATATAPAATAEATTAAAAATSRSGADDAALAPAALRPERAALGRYRIERELGRGSMGTVYLGHDPQIGRPVALKTMALSREFEGSELAEARARFFREAEMAGRLRHPDIVTIFDASEDQGLAFIAMEFVGGHDLLRHTLPGRLLPVPVVLATLARVAQALAHAHREGVVHRDVKPANVMIDPASGSVKVTDFGIARIADACRTRTGLVLGTPSFMSPEQMTGRRVDGRTDLYSLGVMLFQLLTGALPHPSESMATLMSQIVNDTAPDVRSLRPELPQALADIVARALEKRSELRYGDGRQMAEDLLAVARQMASAPISSSPEPPVGSERPAVIPAPDSAGFEATAALQRGEPRHNADH